MLKLLKSRIALVSVVGGLACGATASFALSPIFGLDKPKSPANGVSIASTPSFERLRTQIEDGVREQIARGMQQEQMQFRVDISNLRLEPAANLDRIDSVQVLGLGSAGSRRLDGLFSFPIVVTSNGRIQEFTASGVLAVTGPVWTTRTQLNRGHVVQKEDLVLTQLPWKRLPTGAAGTSLARVIGQSVRSTVSAGEAVYADILNEPVAVKSGDMVELTVISGPGVIIRSRALARQEGRLGELIRLEQPDTKKMLTGTITGDRSVEVRL